ncbi:MAG TPA: CARDB domain-containing protein [Anaerolineales bacterium]|nr:CARDB domain-containing protein [Anaerolineales bacterium]
MKRRAFFQFLAVIALAACQPIVISPTSPSTPPSTNLPDLVISSVYLGMQGIPGNSSNCVSAYAPYEIRAIIENRGTAPAADVLVVEQSSRHQVQIGTLPASQSTEIQIPLTPGGSYVVVADPQNLVAESNESNNVYSYLAPTPTPPALCPPTQPTMAPTMPAITPSPLSLGGLIYWDLNLTEIIKLTLNGQPIQVMAGMSAQFSPDGLQALFESSGDLWLAEPMDNPGVNLTKTQDRYEQFPQWWPSNSAQIIFDSMGINEGQEKNWNHDISGHLSMLNKDGTEYMVLSEVPSYTRPALSADGKTIAYDRLGAPMLYEIGAGARPFDYSLYGYQTEVSKAVFTSPSFSIDGRWLTWWISEGPAEPQRHFSLVMFDLNGKTWTTLHSYTAPEGTLGWLDPPVWSPGGQWMAFQTRSEVTPWDLWVIHSGGGIGQRFGLATNPVWAPDSRRLAYVQWPPHSDSYLSANMAIIDVPSWKIEPTGLSEGCFPLAWIGASSP